MRRHGFTLIEVLIAAGVGALIVGLALPITLTIRDTVALDRARTTAQQTLRAANEMIAADVRIAGARFFGESMSPVQVVWDGDEEADELHLISFVSDAVPVCEPLNGKQQKIKVHHWQGEAFDYTQCEPSSYVAPDGSTWPSEAMHAIAVAADEATAQGGYLTGWIYDPSGTVESFPLTWSSTGNGSNQRYFVECVKTASDDECDWDSDYDPDTGSSGVYPYVNAGSSIVFRLRDGVLERVVGAGTEPIRIASGVTDFDVRVMLGDGTTRDTFSASGTWTDISAIEVHLEVTVPHGNETLTRETTTRFFPRNLLSR